MKLREVPNGSAIRFGSYKGDSYSVGREVKMVWRKRSDDGILVADTMLESRVDIPRSDGQTIKEREHGLCYFPNTFLFKWLNSSDQLDDNVVNQLFPYRSDMYKGGFLSWFSPDELAVMKKWPMRIRVPKRLVNRLGQVTTTETLVGLPSIGEIVARNAENESYQECVNMESMITAVRTTMHNNRVTVIHSRSCIGESIFSIGTSRSAAAKPADEVGYFAPMICIDPENEVECIERNRYSTSTYGLILPEIERDSIISEVTAIMGW